MTSAETFANIALDGEATNIEALLAGIPYARHLGMEVERQGRELTFIMRFATHLIGNPRLPALHGGVIGSFLETAAILGLIWNTPLQQLPKPVDISIDFLRSGRPVDTFARAIITKRGRRVANVRAEAWQEERHRPIASLHGHFLIKPDNRDAPA
ncbi:MAG: PaaI family thioesterase [Alphaproteobacteria bacterium]